MANPLTQFNVKHVDENLLFTKNGKVWAWYVVNGFSYDLESHDSKLRVFFNQLEFLRSQSYDLHFLVIPTPSDNRTIIDEHIERMKYKKNNHRYDLFENGVEFLSEVKDVMKAQKRKQESREYKLLLGIQLNKSKNKYRKGNRGNQFIRSAREFVKGINQGTNYVLGLELDDILTSQIEGYKRQADEVYQSLNNVYRTEKSSTMAVRRVADRELINIIESHYSASITQHDIDYKDDLPYCTVHQKNNDDEEIEVIRPQPKKYADLQSGYVKEYDEETIQITKRFESERKKLYTRSIVISGFPDENVFPNYEWLYKIQKRVHFPVTISMRAYYKDTDKTIKELSNAKLEIESQTEEASKAGQKRDSLVDKREVDLEEMSKFYEENSYPSYSFNVVLKVNANDIDVLDRRTQELEEKLRQFRMEAVVPFGEQPELFMESMPGGEQLFGDYTHDCEPGYLASAMFGASNSLGDGKGFPLGETRDGKTVFIYPELSAKGYDDDNVPKSIGLGQLIAGRTGFGKSVMMNFELYLSVLTGSYAFVLDPKGDRKNWENGLPMIPPEHIRIWTLGDNQEDAGSLDPFRTAVNRDEGVDTAVNIFSYLLDAKFGQHKSNLLGDAIDYASKKHEPVMSHAIDYLEGLVKQTEEHQDIMVEEKRSALIELYDAFNSLKRKNFTSLLIGEPEQNVPSLDHNKPIQVMMVEKMTLPKADKNPENYTADEKIATGIMLSLSSFLKQFMIYEPEDETRKRHKVALFDETSALQSNPAGAMMIDQFVRQGRSYNMTLLKGSQNATDHGTDAANMSMKFSFQLEKREEAIAMLETFNIESSESNIQTLMNLGQGECLFQDIYGRTDVMKVNLLFTDILEAFDTSTADEEEKEFEKQLTSQR